MQKSVEELTQIELEELFEKIKKAVHEEISDLVLESADKYHSFIYINNKTGKPIAIIETQNNFIYTDNQKNKEKIFRIAKSLQRNLGESWSYHYKDRHQ
jgi:hypothetical protein